MSWADLLNFLAHSGCGGFSAALMDSFLLLNTLLGFRFVRIAWDGFWGV